MEFLVSCLLFVVGVVDCVCCLLFVGCCLVLFVCACSCCCWLAVDYWLLRLLFLVCDSRSSSCCL